MEQWQQDREVDAIRRIKLPDGAIELREVHDQRLALFAFQDDGARRVARDGARPDVREEDPPLVLERVLRTVQLPDDAAVPAQIRSIGTDPPTLLPSSEKTMPSRRTAQRWFFTAQMSMKLSLLLGHSRSPRVTRSPVVARQAVKCVPHTTFCTTTRLSSETRTEWDMVTTRLRSNCLYVLLPQKKTSSNPVSAVLCTSLQLN